jgi:predicted GNAT superfamily acetyltransferase
MDMITIRPIQDVAECEKFQEMERLVWNSDNVDVMPVHVLITVQKNGGLLLGAYADDGPARTGGMVGGALGWLGMGVDPATPNAPPKLKFCSHMVGVLPSHQGRRVGLRLKLAQRENILAQGLTDWMTWTFDPLYRPNGVLNIHRLGATCQTYLRNLYGEMTDDLNRGSPSDRFQVDWRLTSPHVIRDVEQPSRVRDWDPAILNLLPTQTTAAGLAAPGEPHITADGRPLAIPLPDDIAGLRRADPALLLAWRFYLRAVVEEAFAADYAVVDCIHLAEHGWRYILVREYL